MQTTHFKDRYAGVIAFGILETLIGLVWLLLAAAMLISTIRQPMPGVSVALTMFGCLAVMSIWLGIGALMARRWARTLSLLVAWGWLASGLLILVYSLFAPHMPGPVLAVFVFITLFSAMFVFFYSSNNVKATFEARDPHIRWTDKCPAPVLILSLTYALVTITGFFSIYKNMPIPFFGTFLTGTVSQIYYVVQVGLSAYLAWGMYKLVRRAWWISVALTVVMGISTLITYSVMDIDTLYQAMNIPAEQIAAMHVQGLGIERIGQITGVMIVLWLGYLIYIRRYFDTTPARRA